jgi:hypothetical protein
VTLIPCHPIEAASDHDCLCDMVQERLHASGYLFLRRLSCEVVDGVVTVSGRVPTFHLKQVAQEVLMSIGSVRGVQNLVQVG